MASTQRSKQLYHGLGEKGVQIWRDHDLSDLSAAEQDDDASESRGLSENQADLPELPGVIREAFAQQRNSAFCDWII